SAGDRDKQRARCRGAPGRGAWISPARLTQHTGRVAPRADAPLQRHAHRLLSPPMPPQSTTAPTTAPPGPLAGASPERRDYPRIVVPPPGPRARAIVDRDATWTSTSYIKEYPLVVARGRGAMVEDVDGNRFLDFMAGIAVASTGHSHPAVVAAITQAAERFLHICGSDFYYDGMAAICERL